MMNAVGLVLLVSLLAVAGVWPPPQERGALPSTNGDVWMKEGHRVIVVEYEREDLRPSASPRQVVEESASVQRATGESEGVSGKDKQKTEGVTEEVKEKLKEAASVLPNLGEGVSPGREKTEAIQGSKICDALGACKEKISEAFGAAKEKVADEHYKISCKVADVEASAMEAARKTVHGGEELAEKVKNASEKQVEDVVGKAKKVKDSAADTVAGGAEKTKHGVSETAWEVAREAKEKAREMMEKAEDAYGRTGKKAREGGGKVQEAAERAKGLAEEGRRNITDIIQRGMDVVYDATMYAVSPETVGSLMRLLHSLAFSVVYGTCFWVTFVSSHVLARALPRQLFGVVQSKIYPVYFRTVTYGIGICLITHYLSRPRASASRTHKLQAFNLLASLGLVLVNMLYIEPRATKVMYDRLKLEKEEGRGRDIDDMDQLETPGTGGAADAAVSGGVAAESTTTRVDLEKEAMKSRLVKMNKRLKSLNSYSSLLNMVSLVGLTWHLVYLSPRQHQQLRC